MNNEKSSSADSTSATHIGRGALYLTATKLWFILASYAIYFAIPRLGGERGDVLFGAFKLVNVSLALIGTVLVMGTTQAVSRFVGRSPHEAPAIRRAALKLQLLVGLVIAGAYFLLAPWIHSDSPELITAARISALIPLIYALYSVQMGSLNGERRFAEQALVDGLFTTLKLILVLGGVYFFHSAAGAFGGFAAAAFLACVFAAWLTSRRAKGSAEVSTLTSLTAGELLRFQIQTAGFMFLVQMVVQLDLKYLVSLSEYSDVIKVALPVAEGGEALYLTQAEAARTLYGSSQLFAQISYSAVISLTFVLFPLVSGLDFERQKTEARNYLREALRYATVIVMGVAAVLTSAPERSIGLQVRNIDEHLELIPGGAEVLRFLGVGYVAFALLFVCCAMLNAQGRPRVSLFIYGGVVLLQFGLSAWLTPQHGLVGQGIASAVAMGVGLVGALAYFRPRLGSVLPLGTLLRTAAAGGAVYAAGMYWTPPSKLMALVTFIGLGLLYLVMLILLREFKADDFDRFAKVLPGFGKSKKP